MSKKKIFCNQNITLANQRFWIHQNLVTFRNYMYVKFFSKCSIKNNFLS
jgi:hypothetical protein